MSAPSAASLPVGCVVVSGDLTARKKHLDRFHAWFVDGLGWFTDDEIDGWISDPNHPARVIQPHTDHSPTS